ncbi:hypothetical protein CSKR_106535 [Clonorchis sinensis]|uniref:Uncharacterized protein n=1 Tax=Clonorchis sinensis TaxID=79923 RepID=A0A3R7GAQ1_CLOSI|nr:hypothetical protein CSKR_106535 [Clonorchis sinensis]
MRGLVTTTPATHAGLIRIFMSEQVNMFALELHIQWPYRDLNPRHLTCEASVLPLLHQRTLDASEFSRLNRRTCSHLSDVIGVPDPSNDDPVTIPARPLDMHC